MLPLQDTIHSRSFPIVNWIIISLNVLVFVLMLSLGSEADNLVSILGVVPKRF